MLRTITNLSLHLWLNVRVFRSISTNWWNLVSSYFHSFEELLSWFILKILCIITLWSNFETKFRQFLAIMGLGGWKASLSRAFGVDRLSSIFKLVTFLVLN